MKRLGVNVIQGPMFTTFTTFTKSRAGTPWT
jgi:hypothetical protein